MVLTGRGGYGNYAPSPKVKAKDIPESPELAALNRVPSTPAPIQHFTSPNQIFRAGRGGYGNALPVSKMHTMTPSEYLNEVHQALDVEPSRYSVGRGGRGNFVDREKTQKKAQKTPEENNNKKDIKPIWSLRSNRDSEDSGLWSRLKSTMSN